MLARRLILLVLVALLALPAVASAKALKVAVTPASPKTTTGKISLSFVADRTLPKRARYVATLTVDQPPPLRRCAAGSLEARSKAGVRKGTKVKLTYVPTDRWSTGRWCAGKIQLLLETATTDSVGTETTKTVPTAIGSTITQDPSVPQGVVVFTPARISLLEGSLMTISAPGHADRVSVLTGVLAARKPGRLIINQDYDFTVVSGAISATQPTVDPLCAADVDGWPASLPVQPDVSTALLRVNGTASYSYTLPVNAVRLTGCRGNGTGASTTVVDFTGKLDIHKLTRLPLTATVSGITLADGTQATVTFSVFVKVDILDESQAP